MRGEDNDPQLSFLHWKKHRSISVFIIPAQNQLDLRCVNSHTPSLVFLLACFALVLSYTLPTHKHMPVKLLKGQFMMKKKLSFNKTQLTKVIQILIAKPEFIASYFG